MNKKILVTGGTGYIGSHTVVELHQAGYIPVIIDDLSNSNIKILDQIEKIIGIKPEFHQFDLCDTNKVNEFVKNNSDISGIIHFAASKAVGESVQNPLKYYHNNKELSLISFGDKISESYVILESFSRENDSTGIHIIDLSANQDFKLVSF